MNFKAPRMQDFAPFILKISRGHAPGTPSIFAPLALKQTYDSNFPLYKYKKGSKKIAR